MLTENLRLLTDERIKEDIFKNVQHKHFLELHLFIVGYRLHGAKLRCELEPSRIVPPMKDVRSKLNLTVGLEKSNCL